MSNQLTITKETSIRLNNVCTDAWEKAKSLLSHDGIWFMDTIEYGHSLIDTSGSSPYQSLVKSGILNLHQAKECERISPETIIIVFEKRNS